MCMKNVNTTLLMCSSLGIKEGNVDSLNGLFDSIVPAKEDDSFYVENLNVILNGVIIFDDRFENRDDNFELDKTYEFMIRFTHVESGLGISLYEFDMCVKADDLLTWCKDFYEFKKVLRIPSIYIPKGLGNYALKLLVRPKTPENNLAWTTQTIHSLLVGDIR